jgi:lysophospholipase L1-like esterase
MNHRYLVALALLASACGGKGGPGPTPVVNPPQITCPADVSVRGVDTGAQSVSFDAPTVTGGAAPVNVACAHASGSTFPLGTTSVSCTASDSGGRQASCSFNVVLTGVTLGVTKFEAIGDSLTEGENGRFVPTFLDPPNAYPTRLQAAFDAAYPGQGVVVINKGHSGDSVETTVRDLNGNLSKDRPGAVLVLAGYNNLLSGGCKISDDNNPRCSNQIVTDIGIGVRDCIRHSKEPPFNVQFVFVSTLTPPGPLVTGASDRRLRGDMILKVNDRIRQVVAAERATLVDTYPTFLGHEADYTDIDGLHLRPAGYQAIADNFFAAIRATIPQTPLFTVH